MAARNRPSAEAAGQPVITIQADSADPKPSWNAVERHHRTLFAHLDITGCPMPSF